VGWILSQNDGHRTGYTRRGFLTAGAAGFGSLTLANLLRAEARAGIHNSRKAVIFVHLDGGPPQMETIDPKPEAPAEIRGELQPIDTALPGLQICEVMPQVAAAAEKFVFIRSLVGSDGRHDAFQCQSGFAQKDLRSIGGRPALGSIVAKLEGLPTDEAPPFVDLMQGRALVRDSARPGFLGPTFKPFRPDISSMFQRELEDGMKNELARLGSGHSTSLTLHSSLADGRLDNRMQLLTGLDRIRRAVDESGMMEAMDQFTGQAVGILTSGRLADALDLTREDPKVLRHYSPRAAQPDARFYTSEGPTAVRKFLLARRLVEAGVRVVSISMSDFDTHRSNFSRMRQLMPLVDHGLKTLVADLQQRGMLDDVTIVAWGEFGRTPRINADGGRDHWPRVGPALIAGGGLRRGQVIGSTDRTASSAITRPVRYKDVIATVYHALGIDALKTTIVDPHGRPQYLLDAGEPLRELI